MKNNRLKIYLVVALLLVMGVGYAYLNQNVELDNSVTISSYEKPGVPAPAPTNITIVSGEQGNLQPGDKIRIGESEDFYVISSDNSANGKTVLLSKYNLMVSGDDPTTTPGYGLQSIDAKGYVVMDDMSTNIVTFSDSAYWDDGEGNLISPYNQNGASYSGNPYPEVYNSNANIYQYISGENGYINKLKTMGAPSTITGRLLTYEEADAIQNVEDEGESIIFNESTYWLGSTCDKYDMWIVFSNSSNHDFEHFSYSGYNNGVRPVIEINTSDI